MDNTAKLVMSREEVMKALMSVEEKEEVIDI